MEPHAFVAGAHGEGVRKGEGGSEGAVNVNERLAEAS
jgi:hypothetical protein